MTKVSYTAFFVAVLTAAASTASAGQICGDASVTTHPSPSANQDAAADHWSPRRIWLPAGPHDRRLLESGVDYIEPDLVMTKDGVLVARHEPNIIGTTDVASHPEFADRKRNATIDGLADVCFCVSDFTLAELKTLGTIQPLAERDQSFNGKFKIPTFDEVIALAKAKAAEKGRAIGIYPETKHSIYHRNLGLPLEEKILAALDKAGWNNANAPVIIQSFEQANLMDLRSKTKVQLAQLVNGGSIDPKTGEIKGDTKPYDWVVSGRAGSNLDLLTPAGLKEVATYADIIAPYKRYLLVENPQLFKDAHAAGLKVHTWTFRDEAYRLAVDYKSDPAQEYMQFFRLGVDGLFTDNCKTAVPVRDQFVAMNK